MLGKKRAIFFEDSDEYRVQKMAGKNARKVFYVPNNVENKKMNFKKREENFFRFTRKSEAKK